MLMSTIIDFFSNHLPEIAITFINCISRSEIRQNFTGEIEEKGWTFKAQFTQVVHVFDLRVQNTNEILDKTVLLLWSQIFEKMDKKGHLKVLKKIQQKKYHKN